MPILYAATVGATTSVAADAGIQYAWTGKVENTNSLWVSAATGALGMGLTTTIVKSAAVNVTAKSVITTATAVDFGTNLVDSAAKQAVDPNGNGSVSILKTVTDATIATAIGTPGNSEKVVRNSQIAKMNDKATSAKNINKTTQGNAIKQTEDNIMTESIKKNTPRVGVSGVSGGAVTQKSAANYAQNTKDKALEKQAPKKKYNYPRWGNPSIPER